MDPPFSYQSGWSAAVPASVVIPIIVHLTKTTLRYVTYTFSANGSIACRNRVPGSFGIWLRHDWLKCSPLTTLMPYRLPVMFGQTFLVAFTYIGGTVTALVAVDRTGRITVRRGCGVTAAEAGR